jgi:ArsR family transcriptional regulator
MWLIHWSGASHDHLHGSPAEMERFRLRFRPELEKLWDGRAPQYSTEMLVLAHRAGAMLDVDLKRFFERLDSAIDDPRPLPSLLSESPGERDLTRDRIERLRDDGGLRKRYIALLRDLWSAGEPDWVEVGRPSVKAEAEKWSRALESGSQFRTLLQVQRLWPPRPETDDFADAAAAAGKMVLTPAWFGGQIHVLEFDGTVYVGRGIRHEGPSLKQVAAEISTRIKSLSDPTRLSIFMCLATEPASVTEIARKLGLSQPTVSAHVQVLREAGLLEEKTVGRSAQLSASVEGLHNLFAHAEGELGKAFRS